MGLHNHNATDICLLHRVKTWTLSKKRRVKTWTCQALKEHVLAILVPINHNYDLFSMINCNFLS